MSARPELDEAKRQATKHRYTVLWLWALGTVGLVVLFLAGIGFLDHLGWLRYLLCVLATPVVTYGFSRMGVAVGQEQVLRRVRAFRDREKR